MWENAPNNNNMNKLGHMGTPVITSKESTMIVSIREECLSHCTWLIMTTNEKNSVNMDKLHLNTPSPEQSPPSQSQAELLQALSQ